ncbi:hypothetical protein DPEC_G00074970 [Dallia pectoralis]|uniref:Uncharacterized protein n=1 Tax=Dallia pectoralis TaxID=75939 RepID=A0ACC2H3I3_DALPE|nr:hypothetical protein DPEC_G00074970 [Dallia pectoralis]
MGLRSGDLSRKNAQKLIYQPKVGANDEHKFTMKSLEQGDDCSFGCPQADLRL